MNDWTQNQEIRLAYEDVRDPGTTTNWCALTYLNPASKQMKLLGKGSGWIDELKTYLKDDMVAYCYLQVKWSPREERKPEYVFLTFIGPNVPILRREKVEEHKGLVRKVFTEKICEIDETDFDKFRRHNVLERVRELAVKEIQK